MAVTTYTPQTVLSSSVLVERSILPATNFGFSHDDWVHAREQVLQLLVKAAQQGTIIYYSDIVEEVGAIQLDMNLDKDRGALGRLLGEISERTYRDGIGMLSAVAVSQSTDRPSNGFYRLAVELGCEVGDRDAFWVDQYNGVTSHYQTKRRQN